MMEVAESVRRFALAPPNDFRRRSQDEDVISAIRPCSSTKQHFISSGAGSALNPSVAAQRTTLRSWLLPLETSKHRATVGGRAPKVGSPLFLPVPFQEMRRKSCRSSEQLYNRWFSTQQKGRCMQAQVAKKTTARRTQKRSSVDLLLHPNVKESAARLEGGAAHGNTRTSSRYRAKTFTPAKTSTFDISTTS